jgi:hypothetical protein
MNKTKLIGIFEKSGAGFGEKVIKSYQSVNQRGILLK